MPVIGMLSSMTRSLERRGRRVAIAMLVVALVVFAFWLLK
jgi:hypothetical protein